MSSKDNNGITSTIRNSYVGMLPKTGVVCVGLAALSTIEQSYDIRKSRGAEAGVFDPMLMSVLAKEYKFGHDILKVRAVYSKETGLSLSVSNVISAIDGYSNRIERDVVMDDYDRAVAACENNFKIALKAGLRCRASLWTSILALLPPKTGVSTVTNTTITNTVMSHNTKSIMKETSFATAIIDELPFSIDVLAQILRELLNGGDVQHFVFACEILKKVNLLTKVCNYGQLPASSVTESYFNYLELLSQLQLFNEACELMIASTDELVCGKSKNGVEISLKCSKCEKELVPRKPTAYCSKCKQCSSNCVLCDQPVAGLYYWCPVCSHGGHLFCINDWFQKYPICPSGCGHDCFANSSVFFLKSGIVNNKNYGYKSNGSFTEKRDTDASSHYSNSGRFSTISSNVKYQRSKRRNRSLTVKKNRLLKLAFDKSM